MSTTKNEDVTTEEYDILYHTRWRASNQAYFGDPGEDPVLKAVVDKGLMKFFCYFLGNPYFKLTEKGAQVLRDFAASRDVPTQEAPDA